MTRSSTSAAGAAADARDHTATTLSTHVLDAGTGRPAPGVPLDLQRRADDAWEPVGKGVTDDDGRCRTLAPDGLRPGVWRLTFDTASYFTATGVRGFYPEVSVVFEVTEPGHHHIPLLLSPFAYSTYRGS
jgi:5-hydroxyisourate hydrolase